MNKGSGTLLSICRQESPELALTYPDELGCFNRTAISFKYRIQDM
jgi:hypothetical protein